MRARSARPSRSSRVQAGNIAEPEKISRYVTCRSAALTAASAGDPDVFCLGSLLALGDVELDLLPLLQAAVAATGDRAEMHEHVRAALDRDEAIPLVAVEPPHSALRHLDLLVVHPAPRHGRALARHLIWPACRGTRGERNRWHVYRPAARIFPARPASTAGANTPGRHPATTLTRPVAQIANSAP